MWMNDSARAHTVTANDGSFDSQRNPVGGMFESGSRLGGIRYRCTLHPFMTGEVDVYESCSTLRAQPARGSRTRSTGARRCPAARRSRSRPHRRRDSRRLRRTAVAADGTFVPSVVPTTTATFRAVVGDDSSPSVHLIVVDHTITASVKRLKGHRVQVDATVTPASPGSKVVLQLHLRER